MLSDGTTKPVASCIAQREILLHAVNHATYHRGHAADILYHLGVFPPATDLPVFLSRQPASPP